MHDWRQPGETELMRLRWGSAALNHHHLLLDFYRPKAWPEICSAVAVTIFYGNGWSR